MSGMTVTRRAHTICGRATLYAVAASLLALQPLQLPALDTGPLFEDVTATHLPDLVGPSMDVGLADIDGDGDLDVILAIEFRANRILINDGSGIFSDETADRLPSMGTRSEDLGKLPALPSVHRIRSLF